MQILAFYLPQFHPDRNNDRLWGEGFSEWTNVAKARPLFEGHVQPRLPGRLGFYDLRLDETRRDQWEYAQNIGVTGFCYWYYWFGNGRRALERPLDALLQNPALPHSYCLAWANESWSGVWHGRPDELLISQSYEKRDERHYLWLMEHFLDERYVRVNGRPLLYLLCPEDLLRCNPAWVFELNEYCERCGIPSPYLVGEARGTWLYTAENTTLDAYCWNPPPPIKAEIMFGDLDVEPAGRVPLRYHYDAGYAEWIRNQRPGATIRGHQCVVTGFDNTPRSGRAGVLLLDATPEKIQREVSLAASTELSQPGPHILFIKSWNEWAEGSIVEPCRVFGHSIGDAVRRGLRDGGAF